jgi:glutamate-1-semialdehyde 2,1-aminomutase
MWTSSDDKALRQRSLKVIPGGMYGHQSTRLMPDDYPQFFERAQGARIWDVDGHEYIDYVCAYGPNLFGYNHPAIRKAAEEQQALGDAMSGPTARIVELAESLVSTVSHAEWAMFCKNGTDATSIAVMAARAHTGNRKILKAKGAYHGVAAWCKPWASGLTEEDRAHQIHFEFNNIGSLERASREAGDDLAGVIVSAFLHDAFHDEALTDPEFARYARELCDRTGALLIVDDVRAGFRMARDCSWATVGVQPDLSCWAKVVANGYPIGCLLGNEKTRPAAGNLRVTGSFWFGAVAMAAAVKTLELIRNTDYLEHLERVGTLLRNGLSEQARSYGFDLKQTGPVQMPAVLFADDPDFRKGYAWTREVLKRGSYLHPFHNWFMCSAMTPNDVTQTLMATDEAFDILKKTASSLGPVEQLRSLFDLVEA